MPVPLGAGGVETGITTLYTTTVLGDPLAWQGTVINEYTVMTIPAAWRAIEYLSSKLAGFPKNVFRRQPNRLLGATPDHPIQSLLNDEVNQLNTPYTFWQTVYSHAIDWGNGYASISRDQRGNIVALYNLPPDRVIPFRYQGQQWYSVLIEGYDQPLAVPSWQILHIPGMGFDGMKGYPIVQLMANALRTGKSAELYGDKFFRNGATGIGSLETEQKLTPDQQATLKDAIHRQHVGIDNAHQWLILSQGLKAKPFTVSNETAQFLETRQYANIDICRIFGVPPHIVYEMDRQTWNNISAMQTDMVDNSFDKWILPSEQEIRRKLFTAAEKQQGFYCRYDVNALLRGDPQQQTEITKARLGMGLTSINEERGAIDLPSIGPAGDLYAVPSTMQSVTALLDPDPDDDGDVDVAPQPAVDPATPPAAAPDGFAAGRAAVSLQQFAGLIADAAKRVHRKTEKAVANALAKHDNGKAAGWVPFLNAFADEQEGYAGSALAPILSTYATVAGMELDHDYHAAQIGRQYATALRGHLTRLGKGEDTTAPDLANLTNQYEGTKWKSSF